jgi:hypothetical protein
MSQIEDCVEAFGRTLDDLIGQGKDPMFIISALGEIAVRAAQTDPEHGEVALRSLAAILSGKFFG